MSFHTRAGEEITQTCQRAIDYANEHNERVDFNFNDVLVTVRPGDSVGYIVDKWFEDYEVKAVAYRNSPEGQASALANLLRKEEAQKKTDHLIYTMRDACKNIDTLVKWLVELSDVLHTDTIWDPQQIAITLEKVYKYERNKHVGQPKEFFDDPQMIKEYIIGQSIECLYMGLPPHQIIHKFAEDAGL